MIVLISPAKSLDFSEPSVKTHSIPRLLERSAELVDILKTKTSTDIQKLMKVSEKIANLNVERYQSYSTPFSLDNAKQAVLAFKGDVYIGLDTENLNDSDLEFANQHIRILSGLYGLLRPLDLIQPYRLEMGTRLQNEKGTNLYHFWDTTITETINEDLKALNSNMVVNLASNEYYKSVKPKSLNAAVYNITFKDEKNGVFKVISFFAKKARGMMCHFIAKHKITNPEHLKAFDMGGYLYNEDLSKKREFVFTR